ncbi:hypothetical protein [Pseudonocardia sp.]|uniref:hypothetical protein n=1 Tax=Pseudonocardia sp. TaxID=60912 RepID=UPI0026146EF5|nr:hypothetical protein [Pseudonocardia sp.]
MTRGHTSLATCALLLLLLPACGRPAPLAATDTGLALRVELVGGFTTPTALATRVPPVSVYADGLVITEGPQIAIFPAPALPNLQARRIAPDDVRTLVQRALDAGVGRDVDLGEPPIADATTTRFVVGSGADREQLDAYALAETAGAPGLTPEQQAARTELNELLAALTDLGRTLGPGAVSAEEPYEPESVAAVVTPWTDPAPELGEQPEAEWPGPELPGEPYAPGLDLSCTVATGPAADAVLAAAAGANSATPWTSAGSRWSVALRPLLPDEAGCADLRD